MLNKLLSVQSVSYNQFRMFSFIIREINKIPGCKYYVDNGNIYVIKGTGRCAAVVSHMDTVHDIVEDLYPVYIGNNITGFNRYTMDQTGIGGDDKCGIYICLQALKEFKSVKVAFFRDEETGCNGSYLADLSFFDGCSFVLQCDRRGNTDFVTNAGGIELSDVFFQADILPVLSSYNYKFATGLMTDVMALKEMGLNIPAANISAGYYNAHQKNEFINVDDLNNCKELCFDLISEHGKKEYRHKYEYKKPKKQKYKTWSPVAFCRDCWSNDVQENGLCKRCNDFYRAEYDIRVK